MPPRTDALRHSGWDNLLLTSSTVTLYFCVEESRDRRPGTKQNISDPRGAWLLPLAPPIADTLVLIRFGSWGNGSVASGSGVDSD